MLFKHPILSRDAEALGNVQNLAVTFVKSHRHVSFEAALQHIQLIYLNHLRICGDLKFMLKITLGLLDFHKESIFTHPTRTELRGHSYMFHYQRCYTHRRQHAFNVQAVPFLNKLLVTR